MATDSGVAQARYEQLQSGRTPYLTRARQAAALTVPHLMPPDGHSGASELPTPFQSLGSRGLRNLASKNLLALFPPNQPFYKYSIDDMAIEEIEAEMGAVGRGKIEEALSKRERAVMEEVEAAQFRPAAFECFRQLLVAGNYLIYVPESGPVQGFRLDKYVVKRDPQGIVLEIILKQSFTKSSLPSDVQALISSTSEDAQEVKTVDLYTYVRRTKKGKYEVYEEVSGKVVPGTTRVFTEELLPWRALRLTRIDGEDYGRGYVEEHLGDLISLEGLSQTVLEGSAVIAKVVTLVNPNGNTKAADIAQANNGAVVPGSVDDVAMLQAEKRADLSVAQQQIGDLQQRLSYAFLMNTSIQRNGERVTAEEIRYMAQELEDALGGMYSLLAQEFQLPMVRLFERRMEIAKKVPPLPKGVTSPAIITGIDALGRGQDLQKLDAFIAAFPPEILMRYVKFEELITRRAAALGVDLNNLVRTEQEIQQAEQQAQLMELAQNLGPQAISAMGQLQGKQMDSDTKLAIEDQRQTKGK